LIAITGATGYLGGRLCAALSQSGLAVRRLTRTPDPAGGDVRFRLGEPLVPEALAGVRTLVHAAHEFRPTSEAELRRINLEGTRLLFESARRAGVSRIVFISSLAAFEATRSAYGRVKLAIERETTAAGGVSVRPGTIFGAGSGGLFAALERAVSGAPVLPDFGARARLHLVHAADLIRVVEKLLVRDAAQAPPVAAVVPVAHPEPVRFREILERIARASGARARFVPMPPALAMAGLRTLEAVKLRPPFRSDSLIGMLHGNPTPGLTDDVLGVPLRPFTPETLRA